jgi:hypothetical protein
MDQLQQLLVAEEDSVGDVLLDGVEFSFDLWEDISRVIVAVVPFLVEGLFILDLTLHFIVIV